MTAYVWEQESRFPLIRWRMIGFPLYTWGQRDFPVMRLDHVVASRKIRMGLCQVIVITQQPEYNVTTLFSHYVDPLILAMLSEIRDSSCNSSFIRLAAPTISMNCSSLHLQNTCSGSHPHDNTTSASFSPGSPSVLSVLKLFLKQKGSPSLLPPRKLN